ncbi:MAG: GHKL domain-containing protein [Treponema sp.]|nr:GHKL domain-containing protein [Treponema sp.]
MNAYILIALLGFMDVLLCCDLYDHFFERRIKIRFLSFYCALVFFGFSYANISIASRLISNSTFLNYERNILNIFLGLTMCFMNYEGKPLELVLMFAVFYICEVMAEAIFFSFAAIFRIDCSQLSMMTNMFSAFATKTLTLTISRAVQHLLKKNFSSRRYKIEGKIYLLLILLPIITISIVIYLFRMEVSNPSDKTFISIAIPMLIFLNLLVFAVVEKLSSLQYEHYELDFFKEKVQAEKEFYDNLDEIERKHASVRHDMKHYISVMKVLMEENKFDEVKKLLLSFENGMNAITPQVYTSNRMINAVLCDKKSQGEKKGIHIAITVEPNVNLNYLSDLDSISLLGNLLDNAIRAEDESSSAKKEITFRLFEGEGQFYIINISNHYSSIKRTKEGFLSTKKEDGNLHGIGLKNIRHIAEKYRGFFNTETENGIFTATVCLPKKDPSIS